MQIKTQCHNCRGTGVYVAQPWLGNREAVVCRECEGSGMIEVSYIPFTERVSANGIDKVFSRLAGTINPNKVKPSISYAEFLEGKMS